MKSAYQINSFSFYATAEISTTVIKLFASPSKRSVELTLLRYEVLAYLRIEDRQAHAIQR
jgi:hypothetical protein